MGGSPGDVSENPVTQERRKKGWSMSCDVGEARKGWRMSCDVGKARERLEMNCDVAELILQAFLHFTQAYVTAHSPTLPSLYLRHSSFSNPSLLHLRHSSFYNLSFASPTLQAPSLTSPGEPPMVFSQLVCKTSGFQVVCRLPFYLHVLTTQFCNFLFFLTPE